ncbi:MAG: cytochrome c, partial [Flavobacteriaceae bacterium]
MNRIAIVLLALFISSCGESENKKKGFEYQRTQKETAKAIEANEQAPVDLSNKGIGPISNVEFGDIDDAMVARGAE